MRELTQAETRAVSGGVHTVVVPGTRPPDDFGNMAVRNFLEDYNRYLQMLSNLYNSDVAEIGLMEELTENWNYINLQIEVALRQIGANIVVTGDPAGTVVNSWTSGNYSYRATDDRTNGVGFDGLRRRNNSNGNVETYNPGTNSWYFDPPGSW